MATKTTSILTGGANNHQTTAEEANSFAKDFVAEGVVGSDDFEVTAQDTPDMTVAVASGVAYVDTTPTGQSSQLLRTEMDASENVTITANSSGSTRYDWVYLSHDADNANEPNTAGTDVATLVTSRSTSSSTDDGTPPTYGINLAVVTVANGASSITSGNITDKRTVTGTLPADGSVTQSALGDDALDDTFKLIGRESLGSAGDTITVSGLDSYKYLRIIVSATATGGNINQNIAFNNDSGNNYARTRQINGGTESTSTGDSSVQLSGGAAGVTFTVVDVLNIADEEKTFISHSQYGAAGAGNFPQRFEVVGKWANTSDAISRVDITNDQAGDYDSGSEVVVFGHN